MRLIVLGATVVLGMTLTQGSFEGIVTYQMTPQTGRPMTFNYVVKGNKVLFQPLDSTSTPGQFPAMIIDQDAKTRSMIMPSRKMFITSPMTDNLPAQMDSTMRNAKIVKVGSETVAGVPCDDYTTSGGAAKDSVTVCVAHGMGTFAMFSLGGMSYLTQLEQHVQGLSSAASGGFFPLKWTGQNSTMVATKVERKTIDAAVFAPPPGYTQMQMPAGAASRMNGANKP
jgi:Domain of unknown function (DUF4412)